METLLETAVCKLFADVWEATFDASDSSVANDAVEKVIRSGIKEVDYDELSAYVRKMEQMIVGGLLGEAQAAGVIPTPTEHNAEAILFAHQLYFAAMDTIAVFMFQLGWRARQALEVPDEG